MATTRGILRDWWGNWIAGTAVKLRNISVPVVEIWGIFKNLNLAWISGFRKVEMETDSTSAYNLITSHFFTKKITYHLTNLISWSTQSMSS